MAARRNDPDQSKQKTQPRKKGAKPIDIPVPKKEDVFRDLEKLAGKRPESDSP